MIGFRNIWNNSGSYKYFIAAFFSGVMLIAAFPPFEQGYAAWIALIPLLWACMNLPPRQAFWAGFIFGLPLHLYLNFYLCKVLFPYLPVTLAVTTITLIVIYISLYNALFALAASCINRFEKPWFTALAWPALWLMMEYLRSLTFLGYNVGYLGYSQWNYTTLLNLASFYGYWGLPFMIVFFQVLLIMAIQRKLDKNQGFVITAIYIILFTAGLVIPQYQTAMDDIENHDQLWVGLIQGNINPELATAANRQDILQLHIDLSYEAVDAEPAVELVVWPETAVSLDFQGVRKHRPEMIAMVEDLEVSVLYGARIRDNDTLYNSIVLLSDIPSGFPVYHKHRLVPFVEYFPLEQFLNRLLDLDLLLGRYTAGKEITIFYFNDLPLAGVICFESYFGDHTRKFAAAGARHLFILTNDAWFGNSIGLEQHAQAAAIRAAEMGIGTTQVANSGITISFDYRGKELLRSTKMEEGVFVLPLDLKKRETVYKNMGDYFPVLWMLFLSFTTAALLVKKYSCKD